MNIDRFSPVLLLLAFAGPVRAQDAGPGVMFDELTSLNDIAFVQDARPGRAVPAQRQAGAPADVKPSSERPQRRRGKAAGRLPAAVVGSESSPVAAILIRN